tara:strand:- start:19703 stop:19972 length:270 start_codon:yes stop_codon:yes gene_type:complete
MAKKRRKLDKEFEKIIYSAKKKIELILAKIYDINDEDIQKEYMSGFKEVIYVYDILKNDYELVGFNENSEKHNKNYQLAIAKFESEYEI